MGRPGRLPAPRQLPAAGRASGDAAHLCGHPHASAASHPTDSTWYVGLCTHALHEPPPEASLRPQNGVGWRAQRPPAHGAGDPTHVSQHGNAARPAPDAVTCQHYRWRGTQSHDACMHAWIQARSARCRDPPFTAPAAPRCAAAQMPQARQPHPGSRRQPCGGARPCPARPPPAGGPPRAA